MKQVFPESVYQILKWVGLIFCPALATLIGVLGDAWGISNVQAIVITINAIGVFIGSLIGVSTANYYKQLNEDTTDESTEVND